MIKNKVIVVIGGAGLIGKEICKAVAEKNAITIIADQKIKDANKIAKSICKSGKIARALKVDITKPFSVQALIKKIYKSEGSIHAVINSAYPKNKNYGRHLEKVAYKDFCENVDMHLGGYFLAAQQFALFFKRQGAGIIINFGSIYGSMAPRFQIYNSTLMTMPPEYAAIKAGIINLTRYFAQYYKKYNIRVNSISPGGVFDYQAKQFVRKYKTFCGNNGLLMPKDLNGIIIFLLSNNAENITGQNFIVDNGFTL